MKNLNQDMNVEKIIKERIKKNRREFSREELNIIKNNITTIIKVYLIAMIDKN